MLPHKKDGKFPDLARHVALLNFRSPNLPLWSTPFGPVPDASCTPDCKEFILRTSKNHISGANRIRCQDEVSRWSGKWSLAIDRSGGARDGEAAAKQALAHGAALLMSHWLQLSTTAFL
jgi:hypothetical protein